MTPDLTDEIVGIVREDLLLGSDRPISPEATLGDLGLDSLGVLQLLTAIDVRYGTELADDVLTSPTPVSLRELARLVQGGSPAPSRSQGTLPRSPGSDPQPPVPSPTMYRMEVLEHRLTQHGAIGRVGWGVLRAIRPLVSKAFSPPLRYVILSRRLQGTSLPPVAPPAGVVLRPYAHSDASALSGLEPEYFRDHALRALESWLAEGAWALVAVEDERVLGIVVQSATGEPPDVTLLPDRQACWGIYLREAPEARGRGIGVALLARSLIDARDRKYVANLTLVWRKNAPMLAATTQLLGYSPIGSATRFSLLGRARWSWVIDGRRGRGSTLVM